MAEDKTLAIIPARGGSKGIPRKNLRPLAGRPLIYYAINACLLARTVHRVVVSTDDGEIALLAERLGAEVHMRPKHLANDACPLDPVILDATLATEEKFNDVYSVILTVQPTSPLIDRSDIDNALTQYCEAADSDTLISVVNDTHLTWSFDENREPHPNYQERLNRQYLPPIFKETGAIIACSKPQILTGKRIGERVILFETPAEKSIDIDRIEDFLLCDSILSRKRIAFFVAGNSRIGLGHVYRALLLATELVKHEIEFFCDTRSAAAAELIGLKNYKVNQVPPDEILDSIRAFGPDLIINDVLDTEDELLIGQKSIGAKLIAFEDLGAGLRHADLIFNALYPPIVPAKNIFYGPNYFLLRDEFTQVTPSPPREDVKNILITFGGADPANLTERCFDSIIEDALEKGVSVTVVLGPSFENTDAFIKKINGFATGVRLVEKTQKISDYMNEADIVFTSGGRTVYEVAHMKTPMVIISQNPREQTHAFSSLENGVVDLGLYSEVNQADIRSVFLRLLDDYPLRVDMVNKLSQVDIAKGKARVISMIEELLQDRKHENR